jgi:hypothetical protein
MIINPDYWPASDFWSDFWTIAAPAPDKSDIDQIESQEYLVRVKTCPGGPEFQLLLCPVSGHRQLGGGTFDKCQQRKSPL